MPTSNSNSNTDSNPQHSTNSSSSVSRSRSPYGVPIIEQYNIMDGQVQRHAPDHMPDQTDRSSQAYLNRLSDPFVYDGGSRPSTPTFVYIVTSLFTSQTTTDGVRLSESDIVGFQILAVFNRIEDANSYAEHECEEIDAGVRRRRRRRIQGGAVGGQDGEGIRAEASVNENGTVSWSVEGVGQIEVGQWVVQ